MENNNNNNNNYHTVTPLDWSDPAWTPVVIRADASALCHAAQGLVELLAKATGAPSLPPATHPLQCAHLLMDQVILDIPLAFLSLLLSTPPPTTTHNNNTTTTTRITSPTNTTGRPAHFSQQQQQQFLLNNSNQQLIYFNKVLSTLIGDKGQTLAILSADAAVRIMIPHIAKKNDFMQLEGDLWNVMVCFANILTWIAKQQQEQQEEEFTNNNNNNNNLTTTTTTTTISTTILLSGLPSQTKLRNIARKTDCQIRKQRKSNTLTVTGNSQERVQAAVSLLQKWQASQQQPPAPPTTTTATDESPRTRSQPQKRPNNNNNTNNKRPPMQTNTKNNNNNDTPKK